MGITLSKMTRSQVMGRIWVYDDEPDEVEVWEHAFVPMEIGRRSGAEWCREYLVEGCSNEFRKMFNLPEEGNYQVLFKGTMVGHFDSYNGEWDDELEIEESSFEAIPESFMKRGT